MSRGLRHAPVVAILIGLAFLLGACGGNAGRRGRVLLVGIDGASLRVVEPLMREGRLPHLQQLAEQGASGPLRSLHPLLSPRIWTTIATGKVPAKHGIENWMTPRGRQEPQRLYQSSDRKVHALWNIASDAGLGVGVVNWLVTYPPEPIRGVMISDHALPGAIEGKRFMRNLFVSEKEREAPSRDEAASEPGGPLTLPEAWQGRALAASDGTPLTEVPDPFVDAVLPAWVFRDKLSAYYAQDEVVARLALAVEQETRPDVLLVLLQGIDRVSHFLWGMLEPEERYPTYLRPSPAEREGGAEALRRYYVYTDALLGRLLERYGPEDLVLVVSDHGFEAAVVWKVMTGGHNSPRSEDGLLFARGPRVEQGAVEGLSVADVTPTILAWLGLPVAEDMDGRAAAFLRVRPDTIATYETKPVERLATPRPSGAEEPYVEQLRELGYVE